MAGMKYWLWLSALTGVSARAKLALAEHYGGAEQAYFAPPGEYASLDGVSAVDAERLESRLLPDTDAILRDCDRQGLRILTLTDAAYPARLRNSPDAPVVLYLRGRLPDVDSLPSVAVIGTRKASYYGRSAGGKLAYELCQCGGVLVSGLSPGVDETAARAAITADGRCIGVLGTPHELCSGGLYDDILQRGALVSEYPPGARTRRSFFRERNRICYGLAAAVVVVEAGMDSNALRFASEAGHRGRVIFAVPGNIDSPLSEGTNDMLRHGAAIALCGWDIMERLQAEFPGKITDAVSVPYPAPPDTEKAEAPSVPTETAETEAAPSGTVGKPPKPSPKRSAKAAPVLPEGLTEQQRRIVEVIAPEGTELDCLPDQLDIDVAELMSELSFLEILGVLRVSDTGKVTRT